MCGTGLMVHLISTANSRLRAECKLQGKVHRMGKVGRQPKRGGDLRFHLDPRKRGTRAQTEEGTGCGWKGGASWSSPGAKFGYRSRWDAMLHRQMADR